MSRALEQVMNIVQFFMKMFANKPQIRKFK